MFVALAHRMCHTTDARLLWRFGYTFGYKGIRSVQRFKQRLKRGHAFPAFLYISITNRPDGQSSPMARHMTGDSWLRRSWPHWRRERPCQEFWQRWRIRTPRVPHASNRITGNLDSETTAAIRCGTITRVSRHRKTRRFEL
jgi:hypothetical protein